MAIVRPLRYVRVNPWESMRRLQEELNDFMWDTLHEVSSGYPPINVWYNDERAVVEAELPGVTKEQIDVEVLGNTVALRGARKASEPAEGQTLIREERSYGGFGRTVQLPFQIDHNGIEASLQRGILTLTLPRKEEDKPKKVQIAAG